MSILKDMRTIALVMLAMLSAFAMVVLAAGSVFCAIGGMLTFGYLAVFAGLACAAGAALFCFATALFMRLSDV